MEDKNPRLGEERVTGRGDENVTGRETPADTWTSSRTPETSREFNATEQNAPPDRRTREIRRDIERTREDMSETVDAIQERLNPRNIASSAVDSVRSKASEKVRDVSDSDSVQYVRANPIPTAMVGIGIAGLAWLAFGGREAHHRSRDRRFERGARDWRSSAGYYEVDDYRGHAETQIFEHDSAERYAPGTGYSSVPAYDTGRGGNWTSEAGSRASHVASDLTRRTRATTYRASNQLQRMWNDNPLLLGAASALVGALVGLALPETERENELMGDTRDNMVEGVQQTVRDKVEQVKESASNVVGQVQNVVGLADDKTSGAKSRGKKGTSGTGQPGGGASGTSDQGRS